MSGEATAIAQFLAGRDVECPRCGYNLRDQTSDRCPECAHALTLSIQAQRPVPLGWYVALWSGAVCLFYVPFAGFLIALIASGGLDVFLYWDWRLGWPTVVGPVLAVALALVSRTSMSRRAWRIGAVCTWIVVVGLTALWVFATVLMR